MAKTEKAVYGEIEIGMHRAQPEAYEIELRVTNPETQGEIAPARGEAQISLDELLSLQQDPAQYGAALTAQLFENSEVKDLYGNTRAAFENSGLKMRVRLLIGQSAPELQSLRWELLHDPVKGAPLATSEQILFSRFMLSRDWRVIRLRPKTALKALIAVAAPSDLAKFSLADVDRDGEIARAREALAGLDAGVVGSNKPLTINALIDAMRGGADILYLVCHGAMPKGKEPCLFLQDDEGKTAIVTANSLATRINELAEAPRLIVLASCESAGDGTPAAQSALAPRLAEAGVPAVLAMQGKISMETVKQAMPVFFRELLKDGQIDRAMAVARGSVRERPDSWMPVLFLRLKNGRIWYEPGFGGSGEEDDVRWEAICNSIDDGEFIPILGPELGEDLFGGTQELALALANKGAFPLAARDRSDLAKVAQFISTKQTRKTAVKQVSRQFKEQLLQKLGNSPNGNSELESDELIDQVLKANPDGSYQVLASLNASVYLNASPEPILSRALVAAGKEPDVIFSLWRDTKEGVKPKPKNEKPGVKAPWVYHVFGLLDNPESLVLTEDDFFDYLIATSKLDLFWENVTGRLMESSMLFLGFRLDDWRFRVLFRMIMANEGRNLLNDYAHVGVQINPDDTDLADVDAARKYLESYLKKEGSSTFSIYWGSSADFLKELRAQMAR